MSNTKRKSKDRFGLAQIKAEVDEKTSQVADAVQLFQGQQNTTEDTTASPVPQAESYDLDPWNGRTIHLRQSILDAFDDLVAAQKEKKRKRRLPPGAPQNAQEVANELFRIGLEQFDAIHND